MKIGIILHPYGEEKPGGLPRMIYQWTKAMLEVDQKNEYIIFFKDKPKERPILPSENWHEEILGTGVFWLDRLRSKPKADVYIFNTPVLPIFWKPPKAIVIALDFPYKYLEPESVRQRFHNILLGVRHAHALKKADVVVAISKEAESDVKKLFGVPQEKISYIPQGYINICETREIPINLPQKFFLWVGTIKERKNVLRIVQAFYQLKQKYKELPHRLVIAGKTGGLHYEKILSYIRDQHIENDVIFLGHRNDGELSYIYRRAEAVIFPSIVEATGNPIIEGMYCGVPVITSNIAGPSELGEGAALLIDPYKVEKIMHAMERILFEGGLREELIRKGHEQVKKFPWKKAGLRMVEEAEKLLE